MLRKRQNPTADSARQRENGSSCISTRHSPLLMRPPTVTDLEVGGPGFCFPVLRWNGNPNTPITAGNIRANPAAVSDDLCVFDRRDEQARNPRRRRAKYSTDQHIGRKSYCSAIARADRPTDEGDGNACLRVIDHHRSAPHRRKLRRCGRTASSAGDPRGWCLFPGDSCPRPGRVRSMRSLTSNLNRVGSEWAWHPHGGTADTRVATASPPRPPIATV